MAKKKEYHLTKIGELSDGTHLIAGLFPIYDSLGMPLEDIALILRSRKMEISFPHFYQEAIKAGWQHKTVMNKFFECFHELYNNT